MNRWGIIGRLANRVRDQAGPTEGPRVSGDGGLQTNLYACRTCALTYISEEMDPCPSCGGPVHPTPTERDLGLE